MFLKFQRDSATVVLARERDKLNSPDCSLNLIKQNPQSLMCFMVAFLYE
jgi:hypothetical protein